MIWEVLEEIIHAWYSTIIVCNDGSTDTTRLIVEQFKEKYEHHSIILLNHPINRGPWAANKTLFEYVATHQSDYFPTIDRWVTYDADGQMDIQDMETFEKYANSSLYDIIIWSRFVAWGKTIDMPFVRRILLMWWRVVTYFFNGSWIKDVTTWYRMYHSSVLPKITITSDRFSYQHQIIDAIKDHDLKFIEVPVTIRYTEYSLFKGQSTWSAWKILKELIYKTFFYK
jgi:glycosyltransferase involved in cell wall biosynthesis